MSEHMLSIEDLEATARSLGLALSLDRLEAILPEVRRLHEHARRLRALPLDVEEPPAGIPTE